LGRHCLLATAASVLLCNC